MQLLRYQRAWLRGDVVAGITVAAYLIPQVMAYAEVAGLPAVAGLWAIIAPLAVYAVLGSSTHLSVGPESTTALMTAAAVGGVTAGSPQRYAELCALLAIIVGALCVVGWIGRLGFLADLLSKPVLVGYMAGIAVLMVVSQIGKLTGISVDGDSTIEEIRDAVGKIGDLHAPTALMAAIVLAALLVLGHFLPRSPGPLLAMLACAAVVALFDLENDGIQIIGDIPAGLPRPRVPELIGADIVSLAPAAVGLAVVAYTDNVLTGRAFAAKAGSKIEPNREFLALAAANVASGLTRGFPVSSSGSRTVIGFSMGARSQMYSLVALVTVVGGTLFLRPVLEAFPLPALGAVVVYAAIRLVEVGEFRRILQFRRTEAAIAVATTIGVLVFDVLYGIAIAVGLSILDLLRRVARPHDGIRGYVPSVAGMHDMDDYDDARSVPGLVVYRYDSPIFFANTDDFVRRALEAVETAKTPTEWFLLNAEANVEIDITGIDALEELRSALADRGVVFALARVKQELRDDLVRAGLVDAIGPERIFPTLPTAVQAYQAWYIDKHGETPPGTVVQPPPPSPFPPEPT